MLTLSVLAKGRYVEVEIVDRRSACGSGVAWMSLGRSQQPAATAAVIQDKTYTVTPAAMKVKDGIVTGEISEMKVTERVEQGSDRVVSPAKLTAKVVLKNSSANQTVRLVAGKRCPGPAHHARAVADRADLKFATYGSSERLDPAREATQSLDVDFPGGNQFRRCRWATASEP